MSTGSTSWDDLFTRMGSGMLAGGVGVVGVWLGGIWFHALVALVAGVMVWELARMLGARDAAIPLAVTAGLAVIAAVYLPAGWSLPLLVAPAMLGVGRIGGHRPTYALFCAAILLAGYGLVVLRDEFGLGWIVWLVVVVMATDIAGYFIGRWIGGPKFWPRVSPKKTWSGTVAGWIVAALVGWVAMLMSGAGSAIIGISVAMSMASQLGDIAESAVKRRAGVKDSSSILPGHGGLFDRFDGMLGAAVFLLLVESVVGFPPVPGAL